MVGEAGNIRVIGMQRDAYVNQARLLPPGGASRVHRLPEIQEELYKVMQVTEKELRSLLKEPSSDPISEVI